MIMIEETHKSDDEQDYVSVRPLWFIPYREPQLMIQPSKLCGYEIKFVTHNLEFAEEIIKRLQVEYGEK